MHFFSNQVKRIVKLNKKLIRFSSSPHTLWKSAGKNMQVQFPPGIFAFDFQVLSRRSRTFVVSVEMGKK